MKSLGVYNWYVENTTMQVYGAWIRIYYVLCSKTYSTCGNLFYRKTSSISRTKSQNLNVCHLVLQLSLPNPLKPNVKLRMKM